MLAIKWNQLWLMKSLLEILAWLLPLTVTTFLDEVNKSLNGELHNVLPLNHLSLFNSLILLFKGSEFILKSYGG